MKARYYEGIITYNPIPSYWQAYFLHRGGVRRLIERENRWRGVNIPEAWVEFGVMSQKDIQDILFCKKHGVEYIAQSFVRRKKDILDVREALGLNSRCRIIAKIKNREGIKNIDKIINA